jgi:hypothetical protein
MIVDSVGTDISLSYTEALQRFADEYFAESGKECATAREIAVWLIHTGRWEAPNDLLIRQCREDVARAMREDYIKDSRGRSVRVKHVARMAQGDRQRHLWADIRRTNRDFMETALQQRRTQIVGDCRQLKCDADYYNDANQHQEPIQLYFDFTDELVESDLPTAYPPKNPR